jgi:hypothetical protein
MRFLPRPARLWAFFKLTLKLSLPLLVGLAVWWAADWFLLPRPTWVFRPDKPLNGRIYGPNAKGQCLVLPARSDWPGYLIDIKSGSLIKQLTVPREDDDSFDSGYLDGPYLWWLRFYGEYYETIELNVIQDEQPGTGRLVHTWRTESWPPRRDIRLTWGPLGTGLLLVQTTLPPELFAIAPPLSWPAGVHWPLFFPDLPSAEYHRACKGVLFELWQLPGQPNERLRLLTSWTLPAHLWLAVFSPDGAQLTRVEPAKAKPWDASVIDARTGKVLKRLGDIGVTARWSGRYLFGVEEEVLRDYLANHEKDLGALLNKPIPPKAVPLCIDTSTGQRLPLPDDVPPICIDTRVDIDPSNRFLLLSPRRQGQPRRHLILERRGDRFEHVSEFAFDDRGLTWLGQGNLLIGNTVTGRPPDFFNRISASLPWLKGWVDKFWSTETSVVRVHTSDGAVLWKWHNTEAVFFPTASGTPGNCLILAHKSGGSYSRLEGYALPIRFISPLLARGIGLAASLLVAVALVRRYLAKRRVAGAP